MTLRTTILGLILTKRGVHDGEMMKDFEKISPIILDHNTYSRQCWEKPVKNILLRHLNMYISKIYI